MHSWFIYGIGRPEMGFSSCVIALLSNDLHPVAAVDYRIPAVIHANLFREFPPKKIIKNVNDDIRNYLFSFTSSNRSASLACLM